MKKIKNFQKISDATFVSHLLSFDPSLYLDSYRKDIKAVQEAIKSECDVDLSCAEAFYFWCWRSDKGSGYDMNEMGAANEADFDWLPMQDAEMMGKWFLEFTSQFVSLGFEAKKTT